MYTTGGSPSGYGCGGGVGSDTTHSTRFSQAESRGIRTRILGGDSSFNQGSEQWEPLISTHYTFFKRQPRLSLPLSSKGDRCIACMTPPPLSDETRLTEAVPQGCPLRAWSADIHRALARRTQGGCAAAREVMTHE